MTIAIAAAFKSCLGSWLTVCTFIAYGKVIILLLSWFCYIYDVEPVSKGRSRVIPTIALVGFSIRVQSHLILLIYCQGIVVVIGLGECVTCKYPSCELKRLLRCFHPWDFNGALVIDSSFDLTTALLWALWVRLFPNFRKCWQRVDIDIMSSFSRIWLESHGRYTCLWGQLLL